MLNTPFSPWPSFTQEEANAVTQVLLSNKVNYWTGQECRSFEREFAAWAGCDHAVALANGTVALELALKVLGIGPGDEVIVTPRTFLASASCIVAVGATPVFVDVDRDSQNITVDTVAAALSARTRAIICVHLAGWPCDMDPIMLLAEERGLYVIEDCAQAHGARYKGRPAGSLGHIAAWSFCQDKIMTTGGEGGMLTTNSRVWWERAWSYKDHGKSWAAVYERPHPPGFSFKWLHESFGTNWRMTEMQAAIGRIQLRRMPDWHAARTRHASRLAEALEGSSAVRIPRPGKGIEHAWYKLYGFACPERLRSDWSRDRILAEINAEGVPCYTGSCSEIYLERAFENTGRRPTERLPVARELGETAVMFLVHPTLSEEEIERTCRVANQVLARALK